jgi:hypothetical protein
MGEDVGVVNDGMARGGVCQGRVNEHGRGAMMTGS